MKPKILSDEELNKIINKKYSSSLMNDSKWVKLIQTLVNNHGLIGKCQAKLIYDDKIRALIIDEDALFNFDFYAHSVEAMITHVTGGWTLYKEIEWISFPRIYYQNDQSLNQDVEKISEIIHKIGQFNDELTDEYYRIYGYK